MKTLAQIQREELERKAASALLALGKLPTANDIQDWISHNHGDFVFGAPSTAIYLQERGGKLDWSKFFKFIDTLSFDSNVAFRLAMDDSKDLVNSAIQGSLSFDDLMARISELEGRAARLLEAYSPENATTDRIPIDLGGTMAAVTKAAIVDSKLAGVLLPMSPFMTQRILTPTMSQVAMPTIKIIGIEAKNIVGSSNLPGQDFQNCIKDSSLPWLHQVICNNFSGPLTVEVSLQLTANASASPQLNRIDLEPAGGCRGTVEVIVQASGPNSLGKQVVSGRKMLFTTKPLLCESMTIRFELDGPAIRRGSMSTYIIGINALRLFNIAYETEGTFQTGWLRPPVKPYIGKAIINAIEDIPAGGSIDWSIRFGNQYTATDWIPIAPQQRNVPTSQKVASTQSAFTYDGPPVPLDSSGLPIGDFPYLYRHTYGMDFYAIGQVPEDRLPDKAFAVLYRGINQWGYTEDANIVQQDFKRDYKSPNSNPLDSHLRLDAYVDEDASIVTVGSQLVIQVAHKIDYNPAKNTIVPGAGIAIGPDGNYSITYVQRVTNTGSENLTPFVQGIGTDTDIYGNETQNIILMASGANLSKDDTIKINYLAGPCGTFVVQPGTVVAKADGKDAAPSVTADGDTYYNTPAYSMEFTFSAKRYLALLHNISAWFKNDVDFVTDIKIGIDLLEGEGIWMDTGSGLSKVESGTTLDVRKGWHQVVIKAKSLERMKALASSKNSVGAILFAKGSFFSQHRAFAAPMLYTDPTVLYSKALPHEPRNFSILADGTIIVPFNPGTNVLAYPYYGVWKGEDNSYQGIVESFEICYNYVKIDEIQGRTDITPEVLSGDGVAIPLKSRHIYDRVSIKAVLKSSGEGGLRMTPIIRKIAVDVQ
jgi:hypothetical protein